LDNADGCPGVQWDDAMNSHMSEPEYERRFRQFFGEIGLM